MWVEKNIKWSRRNTRPLYPAIKEQTSVSGFHKKKANVCSALANIATARPAIEIFASNICVFTQHSPFLFSAKLCKNRPKYVTFALKFKCFAISAHFSRPSFVLAVLQKIHILFMWNLFGLNYGFLFYYIPHKFSTAWIRLYRF